MRYLAVFCVMLASLSGAAAQMTHEETVVRTAYAKLSFAVDINTAYTVALTNPGISPADLAELVERKGLRFTLSNFTVGNFSDIAKEPDEVLGQYPDGQDVIHTSVASATFNESNMPPISSDGATAQWGQGPEGRSPHLTVGQMLPIMEQESGVSPLLRYCTYTVVATLAGRSRSYRASFFFGEGDKVAPGDVVVALGGGAIAPFISHPVYPRVLLETSLWKNPAIRNFVSTTQRPETSCKAGIGEVCCDAEKLQCGVAAADVRKLQ